MATIPSQLPFDTDRSGITAELRRVGIAAAQRLHTDEQYKLFKQTLSVLAKYGAECLADRKVALERRLQEEADAVAAATAVPADESSDKGVGEAQVVTNA